MGRKLSNSVLQRHFEFYPGAELTLFQKTKTCISGLVPRRDRRELFLDQWYGILREVYRMKCDEVSQSMEARLLCENDSATYPIMFVDFCKSISDKVVTSLKSLLLYHTCFHSAHDRS